MGKEQFESTPITKRTKEYAGKQYEVEDVKILRATDIKPGDQIMISTSSGNRYMIRWSKSANAPKVYNERTQFKDGYILHNKYVDGSPVAEVGKSFDFLMITDEQHNKATPVITSVVTGIEIRKGLDKAIHEESPKASFSELADMLKRHVQPKNGSEE